MAGGTILNTNVSGSGPGAGTFLSLGTPVGAFPAPFGQYDEVPTVISGCSITGFDTVLVRMPQVGQTATGQNTTVTGNTLLATGVAQYAVVNNAASGANMVANYWGTADLGAVQRVVYDMYSNLNLGEVLLSPIATAAIQGTGPRATYAVGGFFAAQPPAAPPPPLPPPQPAPRPSPPTAFAAVITGTQRENLTLTGVGNTYLLVAGTVGILSGSSVTCGPGVTLTFFASGAQLLVNGALLVQGPLA